MTNSQRIFFLIIIFTLIRGIGFAQFTQTIRGTVNETVLQTPVAGATVNLMGNKSVITDSLGNFRFSNVPVGTHTIRITHVSFKEAVVANLTVNAGKELVLTIPFESIVKEQSEIIIKGDKRKNKPINELSLVSARAFTVEETQRYAASVNDPLRMATNFAGVVSADDGNNNIVIRGNSPSGLLWRMEGIDIPNPNHFSNAAGSGGGISILSSQLLANSDFLTGAFAAEYGNALSGVFDLKLRKGNNERREFALQAGVLGLNVSAEGPFKKNYKGSYLINYRYSTLNILNKLGVIPNGSPTNFQDLSYNIYLPANKAGTFTLFGFGGLSSQASKFLDDTTEWKNESDRFRFTYSGKTYMNAVTHSIRLGSSTTLKSAISYSKVEATFELDYAKTKTIVEQWSNEKYGTGRWGFNSMLNHKFSARSSLRAGVIVNRIAYNYYQRSKEERDEPLLDRINHTGNTYTVQSYAQWQYKPTNKLTLNGGLHYLQLLLNDKGVVEPRASVKWDITNKHSLSAGYGLHSQVQGLGVYFAQVKDASGNTQQPNKNLGFTQSQHYVLSHQYLLGKNLKLRTELYYQQLSNVPVVNSDTSTFSTLNIIDGFVTDALVNKGKGRNYGLEISLEKYLSNHFYYMFSNSFYQSKYTALDGIERNTRFNGGFVSNLVAGKEFITANQRRTFGINIKLVYQGGFRETPIDIERSKAAGAAKYVEKDAFTLQVPAYYRTDLKLSMKWNRKKLTSTLSLDLQNATNRLNVFGRFYDPLKQEVITIHQNGLIPVLNYKIEF
ncbi:MAG: TonB-dependent receptor [Chitinophagaceae bacterium]|nr:TonB-dependent receptor [Chitinophagaceae bacterium]